jgi:hypothetical protein
MSMKHVLAGLSKAGEHDVNLNGHQDELQQFGVQLADLDEVRKALGEIAKPWSEVVFPSEVSIEQGLVQCVNLASVLNSLRSQYRQVISERQAYAELRFGLSAQIALMEKKLVKENVTGIDTDLSASGTSVADILKHAGTAAESIAALFGDLNKNLQRDADEAGDLARLHWLPVNGAFDKFETNDKSLLIPNIGKAFASEPVGQKKTAVLHQAESIRTGRQLTRDRDRMKIAVSEAAARLSEANLSKSEVDLRKKQIELERDLDKLRLRQLKEALIRHDALAVEVSNNFPARIAAILGQYVELAGLLGRRAAVLDAAVTRQFGTGSGLRFDSAALTTGPDGDDEQVLSAYGLALTRFTLVLDEIKASIIRTTFVIRASLHSAQPSLTTGWIQVASHGESSWLAGVSLLSPHGPLKTIVSFRSEATKVIHTPFDTTTEMQTYVRELPALVCPTLESTRAHDVRVGDEMQRALPAMIKIDIYEAPAEMDEVTLLVNLSVRPKSLYLPHA